MVWKSGKFGVNNGRTVRSTRFGRARGKRSEGLLIQTTALTVGNHDEGEFEVITFSLGKQNRWLLPEVIKENSVEEIEKEDEVVLVERYTNEGNDRPDCFSVYNSKNSTTRKSKRKFARAKDLLSDIKDMKTRYEVSYPNPAGIWQSGKQPRRQTSNFGTRKKNSFVDWNSEGDVEEGIEADLYFHDIDEDYNEHSYSNDIARPVTLDLGLLLKHSAQKKRKCREKITTDSVESLELPLRKGDCIYVESEDMHNAHHELLAQIRETSSGYGFNDSPDWSVDDPWNTRAMDGFRRGRGGGRGGRGRGGGRSGHFTPDYRQPTAYDPNLLMESSKPFTGNDQSGDVPSESNMQLSAGEDFVSLLLTHKETDPKWLKEKWGERYQEAACLPRAFILDVSPETCQCSGEIFVLFQLDDKNDGNIVKAQVSTVVACDEEGMHESVLAEFISKMKTSGVAEDIWRLEEVMNIAKNSFYLNTGNKAGQSEPRQPKLSLDVFMELFGWSSKVFSLKRAQREVKQSLAKKGKGQSENSNPVVAIVTDDNCQYECGVCFTEFLSDDSTSTSLLVCGHVFCNSCWRAHLRTQIEQGRTDLQCPGYECDSAVDDVTVMSLVPSLYGRHLTKRLDTSMEMNPAWKWCPADRCSLVVKATKPLDSSVTRDVKGDSSVQPVPVVCVCGTMWCLKCQEDAHWPAACEEAGTFRQKNAGYAKMVENSKHASLITSVDVKNCPSCRYPIQKGPGCNHMHCGLCNVQFCWWCLETWDWEHVCKEKVQQRQVELPISTKHLRSYEHFAVTSRIARSTTLMKKVNKKLDKLEKELQIYLTLVPKVKANKPWRSCTERRLQNLLENNTVQDLREAFSFKFQALLALEGLAIVLSFVKDSPNKRLAWEFERLLFISERMNEILQDFNKCVCHEETLKRLQHFVVCGKECLFVIASITKQSIN